MKLKSLQIKNVRSYIDEKIEFPDAKILFEGDIGSGKSTILYAIEFALFGLGELKGSDLLRAGADSCSAVLVFEVNNKIYEVKRELQRKNKNISQSYGSISYDGKLMELSSSEMKSKILEILDFKENTSTKSSSVIFRYAVFTPQESMKEILSKNPEERLQTLRKAFGIEEYRTAKENSKIIKNIVSNKIAVLSDRIKNIERINEDVLDKKKNIDEIEKKISELKINEKNLEKEIETASKELSLLEKEKERILKIKAEIPQISKMIKEIEEQINSKENSAKLKNRTIAMYSQQLEELKIEIEKAKKEIEQKPSSPSDKKEDEIELKIREIEKQNDSLKYDKTSFFVKMKDYKSIKDKKICPTCFQAINSADFDSKIGDLNSQIESKEKEILENSKKLEVLKELVKKISNYNRELEKYEGRKKVLDISGKSIEEKQNLIQSFFLEIEKENKEIIILKEKFAKNSDELLIRKKEIEGNEIFSKIEVLEREKRRFDDELRKTSLMLTASQTKLESEKSSIKELEEEILRLKKEKDKKEVMEELRSWIDEHFVPAISNIEKYVLYAIREQFESYFKKWFFMLIESSDKSASIDEQFTPIIEQNGYELSVNSLSGGERTSLALAYRLSLNLMVMQVCSSMKSNLLILDEPTDGFSSEQMMKVRDVLNEALSGQMIIVSHEKSMESFADVVFRIEKNEGLSKINRVV